MKDYDKIERILVILIMVVELVIVFKAIMIDVIMGLGFWLLFHGLDLIIAKIHQKYFRDNNQFRK